MFFIHLRSVGDSGSCGLYLKGVSLTEEEHQGDNHGASQYIGSDHRECCEQTSESRSPFFPFIASSFPDIPSIEIHRNSYLFSGPLFHPTSINFSVRFNTSITVDSTFLYLFSA
ncbi:hypothetical protein L873DRAFT_360269 [Choiromyces venosus 120613-1]|uniref:Uncharacterized protein n=1 Tax=Choiromyces venosus 120613-1 TaxID=1336337 RepID=A0A3N4J166_9PEZI|nr:hypothetical protein L873DRAFT_360269 [Choiromyces venosus 120613-1]